MERVSVSGQTRMSASIRELGGQMLLPGEEVDFNQLGDPEVRMNDNTNEASGEQQVQSFPDLWQW